MIKVINSVSLSKSNDFNYTLLNKEIQNLPGAASLNQLLNDYESNGKWLNENITIPKDLNTYINVKGNTLIYSTKIIIDMGDTNVDLKLKSYLTKTEDNKPLDVTYYLDYSLLDINGKKLISFKVSE